MIARRQGAEKNASLMGVRAGRGERIRTSDILLPKQALYQAELRPEALKLGIPGISGKSTVERRLLRARIGRAELPEKS